MAAVFGNLDADRPTLVLSSVHVREASCCYRFRIVLYVVQCMALRVNSGRCREFAKHNQNAVAFTGRGQVFSLTEDLEQ